MIIRIYGASGSGKSYTARNLSKKLNLTHVDLDDFFARKNHRTVVPNQEEAIKKMNELILKNNLVIEGSYFFPMLALKYDKIIILKPPFYLSILRIWKRFFKEKNRGFTFIQTIKLTRQVFRQYFKDDFKHYRYFRYKNVLKTLDTQGVKYELRS